MATISTGAVAGSGTSTYISSLASGLDTDALVETAVAQKTARADTIDARVAVNESKIAVYENVQSLIDDLAEALEPLAASTFSVLGTENAFDARQAYLSGSDTSSVIAVGVEAEAQEGAYSIEVQRLAAAMKVASAVQSSAALGLSGTFQLGLASEDIAAITVTESMSLSDIAAAINAQSEQSGVSATLLRTGTDAYRLVLTGAELGAEMSLVEVSGDIGQSLGLVDGEGAFTSVLSEPATALFTLDGITIESASNDIDDVMSGVSLTLLAVTSEPITLTIEPNYESVQTAITAFIDAYNALRAALGAQQVVNADGTLPDDVVLFADAALRTLSSTLSASAAAAAGEGDIATLAQLGIVLGSDGYLSLDDETALETALLSNFADLASFFETKYTSSDPDLQLLRNELSTSMEFELAVTVEEGGVTGVTVNGQSGLFTIEAGNRLVGAAGSLYEGLSFAYVANDSATISVSIVQGFANRLTNLINSVSANVIDAQVDRLNDVDTQLEAQSTRIREDAELYRERMIAKYAKMEAKVAAAQLLLQQLEAILESGDDE